MRTSTKAIFLSYASQDVEAARRICDALRVVGIDVWFDQSELRGGEAWDASIRRQIKECALFVPVVSANTESREEGYFRLEWKLAVDRSHFIVDDKPFLLPVVIDATLDVNARVPEKFREVQWTHLPEGEGYSAFAEQVQRLLSSGAAQPGIVTMAATATQAPSHGSPSIAVLPFVNRSHDVEDEYFSDGLADELLNVLAKIRGLRVAARSSAYTFKGKPASITEVGRALNVATVLEGSVRKFGNRMRISVQLVKVADGYHLWSESYDRRMEDIFAVQDDIAQSVVKELRIALMGETVDARATTEANAQMAAAIRGRATDPEVHRLYLHARYLIDRLTRDDITKGISYLKLALERDPAFALAWAELGEAYAAEANSGWAPVVEGYQRAREAVTHALSLAPDLAEAQAELGWIQMSHDWDWRGAEASYRRALELAPGDATVLRRAAMLALNLGRVDEAIRLYRRAVEQDPLSSAAYANFGDALGAAGSLGEAELGYRKALELAPQRAVTRAHLALNLWAQGRHEGALSEAMGATDDIWRNYALAIIHRGAGRHSEAAAALRDLIAKYAESAAYQIAEVHAACGETDHAFAWLERAYTQRDLGLSQMKTRPLLLALHADPRWDPFLRKMGLAD